MATRPEVFVPAGAPITQERQSALGLFWALGHLLPVYAPLHHRLYHFRHRPGAGSHLPLLHLLQCPGGPALIGWSNYKLLFLEDDVFLKAIGNTLMFAMITGPAGFFISSSSPG